MSRCLPYPPPGYSLNKAKNPALIELIKLQKERVKGKSSLEKTKKNGKRKLNDNEKIHDHDEKTYKLGKSLIGLKKGYVCGNNTDKAEQLEKSGLTEEHGLPSGLEKPSYSSDTTQNSDKRKIIDNSPSNRNLSGKVVRIRLITAQKHKEVNVLVGRGGICTTSGRTELPLPSSEEPHSLVVNEKNGLSCRRTETLAKNMGSVALGGAIAKNESPTSLGMGNVVQVPSFKRDKEPPSTSGRIEKLAKDGLQISTKMRRAEKKKRKMELRYKNLFETWTPTIDPVGFDGDQEWLFGGNDRGEPSAKIQRVENAISYSGPTTLLPCAQFLSHADMYALPYTVPY